MATRARIALELKDGSFISSYQHWDGYPGGLGYNLIENWDNYDKVPFWNQLDIIGIDAYFSYSNQETPTVSELKKSMIHQAEQLEVFSKQNNKSISFLEYGFRSKNIWG